MSSKTNGISFGVSTAKNPNTPVFPTRKTPVEVLNGFMEFALRNRDDRKLTEVLGYGLEATLLQKSAAMHKLAAECGEDPEKIAALYDRIQGTATKVFEEVLVSIPGPGHDGIGFYPIELWTELEWHDGTEWKTGYLSSLTGDEGRFEISDEEDPMSSSQMVEGACLRRKGK